MGIPIIPCKPVRFSYVLLRLKRAGGCPASPPTAPGRACSMLIIMTMDSSTSGASQYNVHICSYYEVVSHCSHAGLKCPKYSLEGCFLCQKPFKISPTPEHPSELEACEQAAAPQTPMRLCIPFPFGTLVFSSPPSRPLLPSPSPVPALPVARLHPQQTSTEALLHPLPIT